MLLLPPERPERPYRGGALIDRFRRTQPGPPFRPEEFVGSTVQVGPGGAGLTRLAGGTLDEAIAAAPDRFLGPAHLARFGADPALLVKLLHPAERLFAHLHPDDAFAAAHLGSARGKTEAWIVLEAPPGGGVAHVGLREDVDPGTLAALVRAQDAAALLALLNPVPLTAGDTVLVPAGTVHAIGPGLLIAELQQPTDFSILLEWAGYDLVDPGTAFLGLDEAVALGAADLRATDAERLAVLTSSRPETGGRTPLLPPEADAFFRAERLRVTGGAPVALEPAFAVLVATAGAGTIAWAGGRRDLAAGDTALVPFGAGRTELEGDLTVLRCRPPAP